MKEPPERVRHCTTHHHACDCREWKFEQMEATLKNINRLALRYMDTGEEDDPDQAVESIHSAIKEFGL